MRLGQKGLSPALPASLPIAIPCPTPTRFPQLWAGSQDFSSASSHGTCQEEGEGSLETRPGRDPPVFAQPSNSKVSCLRLWGWAAWQPSPPKAACFVFPTPPREDVQLWLLGPWGFTASRVRGQALVQEQRAAPTPTPPPCSSSLAVDSSLDQTWSLHLPLCHQQPDLFPESTGGRFET